MLHRPALGSVPRSIEDPITTDAANITGFLSMLVAARDANRGQGVKRFVYAASSSTYGDHPGLPKVEDVIGKPLSPYAVTKYVNELYADVFARCYGLPSVGLRYFNVFGPRQDPEGAYAAVIPKWIASMIKGEPVYINGDGETSRDYCFIANVVQANLLAATTTNAEAVDQVYNVAVGEADLKREQYAAAHQEAGEQGEAANARGGNGVKVLHAGIHRVIAQAAVQAFVADDEPAGEPGGQAGGDQGKRVPEYLRCCGYFGRFGDQAG